MGIVSSIDGRTLTVRVDQDKNLSHLLYQGRLLRNVSVGSYLKIRKGFEQLVGRVAKEYVEEIRYPPEYGAPGERIVRYLSVQLVGYFRGGDYKKGVQELPLMGDECFILDEGDYKAIHGIIEKKEEKKGEGGENGKNAPPEDELIPLGRLMADESIPISVSVNKLFASHVGIFGNTGSGKSYTLASLYKGLFDRFLKQENKSFQENARFLLFDFNGEYTSEQCITQEKTVYNLSTQSDQGDKIKLRSEDILDPETVFILSNATEKTQQPFIRRALARWKDPQKGALEELK